MKRVIILLLILIVSIQTIHAHNPLSAMYYLEVKENINILNINLSQTGFHEALKKQYSKTNFEELPLTEYKQLAVNYLKENFHLVVNGTRIQLLDGGLKLGSHQTDAKFITSELPKTFESLEIKIQAFTENEQHQTVFSLLLNGKTSKVILNKKNDYSASVIFKDGLMIDNHKAFNSNYLWCLVLIPIFLVGKKLMAKPN